MAGRCMANAGRRSLRRPRPNDNLWALLRAQLDRLEPREEETVSAPEPEPWRPYRVGRMDEFLGSEVAQKDTRHATPQTRLEVGNRPVTDEDVERALAAQAALRTLVRKAEADAEVRVRSPPHASRRPTLLPQLPQLPPPLSLQVERLRGALTAVEVHNQRLQLAIACAEDGAHAPRAHARLQALNRRLLDCATGAGDAQPGRRKTAAVAAMVSSLDRCMDYATGLPVAMPGVPVAAAAAAARLEVRNDCR